jgi:hypothetical protein
MKIVGKVRSVLWDLCAMSLNGSSFVPMLRTEPEEPPTHIKRSLLE